MLKVDKNIISMVQGDNASFNVNISPFTMEDGDTLTFTIKKDPGLLAYVSKTVGKDEPITLLPEDTNSMEPGYYKYDVELKTNAGEVFTVMGPALFKLIEQITTEEDIPITADDTLYTKTVNGKSGNVVLKVSDLANDKNYMTGDEVNTQLTNEVDEIKSWADDRFCLLSTGYATQEEVEEISSSLGNYATEDWVEAKGYLTEHQDLSNYATKQYADTAVANAVDGLPEILETIQEIKEELGEGGVVDSILTQLAQKANTADLSTVATSGNYNDLSNKPDLSIYLTEHQDLSNYATLGMLDNLETTLKAYTDQAVQDTDLTGYATQSWVQAQNYITAAQSRAIAEEVIYEIENGEY